MRRSVLTYIRADQPLTRDEFLAHCHWRSAEFREFLIRLWQDLPPVLQKVEPKQTPAWVDDEGRMFSPPAPEPAPRLPVEPEHLGAGFFALRPRSFTEFALVSRSLIFLPSLAEWWTLVPFGGVEYAAAVGRTGEACREALARFRLESSTRWPRWAVGRLRDPHELGWWSARPGVVVRAPASQMTAGPRVVSASEAAFGAAHIWLPVYEDTTAASIDWAAVAKLQAQVYGQKQRSLDEDYYEQLLYIWDLAYDQGRPISEIARALTTAESTVKSRALLIGQIILGIKDKAAIRRALRAPAALETDMRDCPICSKATTIAECCPRHLQWAEQDGTRRRRKGSPAK
jgi:hypothetical protein